jgi:hypothetical protein
MSKEKDDTKSGKHEKEMVLEALKNLMSNPSATLNTKFLNSHSKVALMFQDHIFEIHGEDEKFIKYMALKVPISSAEHKELLLLFMDEVHKRAEDSSMKKLNELRNLIKVGV